jgi:hypothetical protein
MPSWSEGSNIQRFDQPPTLFAPGGEFRRMPLSTAESSAFSAPKPLNPANVGPAVKAASPNIQADLSTPY